MESRFRRLAVVTTGLTWVLILLGLYTGATGGGLSCGANWPLCDGAVLGLFPATWSSFFEWSHRLVAMVVGVLLLGTLYGAWRWQSDRRVRWAVTGAIALLPAQVGLGAVTTTAGGAFPGGFHPLVMLAHFATAAAIFTLLVVATVLVHPGPSRSTVKRVLGAMAALAAIHAVVDVTGPFAFRPGIQTVYYGASYAILGGFVALATASIRADAAAESGGDGGATAPVLPAAVGYAGAVGGLAVFADMVLSRRLLGVDLAASHVTTAVVFLSLLGALVTVAGRSARREPGTATTE
jgi:cytochrome c oxidase assembly protein subunit 15